MISDDTISKRQSALYKQVVPIHTYSNGTSVSDYTLQERAQRSDLVHPHLQQQKSNQMLLSYHLWLQIH